MFVLYQKSERKVLTLVGYKLRLIEYKHKQQVLYHQTLSTIPPSTGKNKHYGNILLYKTFVISIMVGHFDYEQRCRIEKNVPIALILPSRWRYGAESLGMERTSCLCYSGCPIPPIKDQYAVVFDPLTCLIKVRIQIRSLHTASATTRMTKMKLYF